MFSGLEMNLGNLSRLSNAKSRSLSPENFNGEKGKGGMSIDGPAAGCARDLGQGWKVSPFVRIAAGQTFEVANIDGPGAIQQIWMTPTGNWRYSIIRFYWDGEETPSVECPVGDFFGMGWGEYAHLNSLAICVNPGSAFNCYWTMPFRKHCRITFENLADDEMVLYYQVNYTLTEVPEDAAYFHAQWRRTNPLPYKEVYTIVDGIKGQGHYVGTYMAWQVNNTGWWGEGEIKFFMDGDKEDPTICGTGTEDYFCGAWGFGDTFTGPYTGYPLWQKEGERVPKHGLYRWHIMDPIRFHSDLKVTMQALGWWPGGKFQPLTDEIASVGYWYQQEPHAAFPVLPSRNERLPR